jgi:hypothetical protein
LGNPPIPEPILQPYTGCCVMVNLASPVGNPLSATAAKRHEPRWINLSMALKPLFQDMSRRYLKPLASPADSKLDASNWVIGYQSFRQAELPQNSHCVFPTETHIPRPVTTTRRRLIHES